MKVDREHPAVIKLFESRLLEDVTNQHGEADIRCTICSRVGDHAPLCAVLARLKSIASRAVAVMLLVLLFLPASAGAQERRDSLTLPTVAFFAGMALDDWSTVTCHNLGCQENNPTIAWLAPHGVGKMLALNEGINVAGALALRKWIAPSHPKLAAVTLYAVGAIRINQSRLNWNAVARQRTINALRATR